MGYLKPTKDYKADYYLKNIQIYKERNKKYREKQKALKAGIYVEEKKVIIDNKFKIKQDIVVDFI
jgi:hypothetical protein